MADPLVNSHFASIDIGSHTIRMLIAKLGQNREVLPVRVDRRITRLARDFSKGGTLEKNSMDESIVVLIEFSSLLHRHQVRSFNCGATGVLRRAGNTLEFMERVREATGISPSILSEEAEAYLSAKGILSGLACHGVMERYALSFDLGGSSTEFILIDTSHAYSLWSTSIFIGAATVTERYLPGDPPGRSSVVHAGETVRDALSPAICELRALLEGLNVPPQALQLVGTAGTATTLAAMLLKMNVYEPSRVTGLILTEEWLTELINLLSEMPLAERQRLAGLEKGREAVILGGALIIREVLQGLGHVRFTVVDSGLLEGLLLALIEKEYGWPESLSSPLTFKFQGR